MILVAGIAFFASLLLICTLFALKVREIETGRSYAPRLRSLSDRQALHVKDLLFAIHIDVKKLLPLLVHWGHVVVHLIALKFAAAARAASFYSHGFANLVSQKRNFQRRHTGSEFFRKVSRRKHDTRTRNGEMDTTRPNE